MAVPLDLQLGEKIIHEDSALWMRANLYAHPGRLTLTNMRLVFCQDWPAGGMLAHFIIGKLMKSHAGGIKYDIQLKDISFMKRDDFGKNVIMLISYERGKRVRFGGLTNYDLWKTLFKEAKILVT